MLEFWFEISSKTTDIFFVLMAGYLLLLVSWPGFLLLEKLTPAQPGTPRSNYWLNWRITLSNLFLAPFFSASVTILTIYLGSIVGLPGLEFPIPELSVGVPVLSVLLQGTIIFFTAAFLGDFAYYWWHRLQHTVPFLWELHKLHHSDENLNSTTIFRSHFLEPAGQGLIRGLTIGLIFDTTQASENILYIVAGGALLGLWDFFVHANVRIDALHRLLPFFSNPQFHWIHHSKEPEHQDKNYSIWLPLFDIAFGSYYHPRVDEYPPTGLSSGEKIETVWEGQTGPFVAWTRMIKNRRASQPKVRPN